MKSKLDKYSSSHSLDYYTNKENIPNQELVTETIEYFQSGAGARAFKPLEFLNLLDKQYHFLVENVNDSEKILSNLNTIPLKEIERHILFGLLIKWFGGYPVNNFNESYDKTLKDIEKLFLSFPGPSPEKEFCKADRKHGDVLKKLELALNTSINTGIDVNTVLEGMQDESPKKELFSSFEELFDEILKNDVLQQPSNNQTFLIERTRYNFTFNVWLQNNKDLKYGDKEHYESLLSIENFLDFLRSEKEENERIRFLNTLNNQSFQVFVEANNALRKRFRVKREATAKDCSEWPRLKVGDVIEFEPQYKSTLEAYTLMTEYYAASHLELEKHLFIETYKSWNNETIKAEIGEIERFIGDANKKSMTDSCKAYGSLFKDNDHFVYNRFKCRFYENLEIERYPEIAVIGSTEARIYGRYFLFYEFLKNKISPEFTENRLVNDIKEITGKIEIIEQAGPVKDLSNYDVTAIKKYLNEVKEAFTKDEDYNKAVELISMFFSNQSIDVQKPIFVKNGNIKNLAYVLGQIWREHKNEVISYEYLQFYKKAFSIFKDQPLSKKNIFSNNLYKYSISKT